MRPHVWPPEISSSVCVGACKVWRLGCDGVLPSCLGHTAAVRCTNEHVLPLHTALRMQMGQIARLCALRPSFQSAGGRPSHGAAAGGLGGEHTKCSASSSVNVSVAQGCHATLLADLALQMQRAVRCIRLQ